MGMRDESWCNGCGGSVPYTEDDEAYCGECALEIGTEYAEKLIAFIENKLNENEQALSDIHAKYESGGTYDKEDTTMSDYYEGAVEALGIVLDKAKEMFTE
jgi:hypothetical protein